MPIDKFYKSKKKENLHATYKIKGRIINHQHKTKVNTSQNYNAARMRTQEYFQPIRENYFLTSYVVPSPSHAGLHFPHWVMQT